MPIPEPIPAPTLAEPASPVATTSLEAFFHHSLSHAVQRQGVEAGDVTIHYLVKLLTHFSRSENLFDYTEDGIRLRPLAQLYAQAVQSKSPHEQRLMMRRMGDVALFITGMFSGFFTRRRALVGMDYYIAMGERAYGCLSQGRPCDAAGGGLADVFGQLSSGFGRYVMVIAEVGDAGARQSKDELGWLREARVEGGMHVMAGSHPKAFDRGPQRSH